MMTENTKQGVAIVAGIANLAHAVNHQFPEKEQLNQLLTLFDHHPDGTDGEYVMPDKLVLWAYDKCYDDGNAETGEYIRKVFPWFVPQIDRSLL